MRTFYLIILAVVSIKCVNSQFIPPNPCPNFLQYFQFNNGVVYGRLQFQNDFSGYYVLTLNMSLATLLPNNQQNLRLELLTGAEQLTAGSPVVYNVYFPIQDIIPKPTRIEFNRRVYCSGPPHQVGPGRGVTNMWATTFFRITYTQIPNGPNSVFGTEFANIPPSNNPFSTPPSNIPFNTQSSNFPSIDNNRPLTFTFINTPPSNFPSTDAPTTSFPFIFTPTVFPTTTFPPPTTSSTSTTTQSTTPTPFTSALQSTASTPSFSDGFSFPEAPNSNSRFECGQSSSKIQPLIVNGDSVEEGEYPWMVAIMFRQNFNYKYGCTGSLINDRHVITAAHCVWFFNAPLYPAEDLLLVFGKVNLKNWANGAVIRDVLNVTAHPSYQLNKGDGDVAVLTLKNPVRFERNIQPVCLWQESDDLDAIVNKEGAVAGWGRDEYGENFVVQAKKVQMPVVSQVTCLRSDVNFADVTSNRTFCAGRLDGSGPCSGDSGAGFVMSRNGKWTLRGVVSLALKEGGTCSLRKYSVFADVPKYKEWFKQFLR